MSRNASRQPGGFSAQSWMASTIFENASKDDPGRAMSPPTNPLYTEFMPPSRVWIGGADPESEKMDEPPSPRPLGRGPDHQVGWTWPDDQGFSQCRLDSCWERVIADPTEQ